MDTEAGRDRQVNEVHWPVNLTKLLDSAQWLLFCLKKKVCVWGGGEMIEKDTWENFSL